MKKAFLVVLVIAGALMTADVNAQQMKIGVFDLDLMVQAMPKYRAVDSMLQRYERDSLANEYEFYNTEYKRLDSTYKADSAAGKSKTVLDLMQQQRQQVALNIVYWQQIAQNKTEQKRAVLAQPLYEQVANAYKKVLDARKYTLILKPNTFELGSQIENIFPYVARELKIQLPAELGGGQPIEDDEPAQKPAKPAQKPAAKPKG